jgi:LPXTG-motif cell wall-anchored protein
MSFTLKATVTVAIAAAAALIIPTAAQASGAGLPSGESIYSIPWTNTGGLVGFDTSGSETAVFAGTLTNTTAGRTAFNAADHSAYWLVSGFPTQLYKTDITTGVSTHIGAITGGVNAFVETIAIDGSGHGYVILDDTGNANAKMYSLDLTSGALTLIHDVATLINSANSQFNVLSIAYNPADNLIYAINRESGTSMLSTVNLTGTVVTDLGAKAGNNQADPGEWSNFAFDSAGTMWSISNTDLWKSTPASWTATGSTLASTTALVNTAYTFLFVAYTLPQASSGETGSEVLANTGTDASAAWTFGGVAAFLIVAGLGAISTKRRRS